MLSSTVDRTRRLVRLRALHVAVTGSACTNDARSASSTSPVIPEGEQVAGLRTADTVSLHALRPEEVARFWVDGFVHRKALFTPEEAAALAATAKADELLMASSHQQTNEEGVIAMCAMNVAGRNWVGAVARCGRIVDSVELLFGKEMYHYHSKVWQQARTRVR